MSYHLGDLPFRDEWNHSVCMFDLFLWGVLAAFPQAGVYEFQVLALLLKLTWLLALVLLLRRYAPLWLLAVACIPVAFMTRGVKTPGYNELGQFGLLTALPLWLWACVSWQRHRLARVVPALGGVLLTIGVLSYTPLVFVLAVPVGVLLFDRFRRGAVVGTRPATWMLLLTVVVCLILFAAILALGGLLDDYYAAARWHVGIAFGGSAGTPTEATVLDRVWRLCGMWLPFVPHFVGVLAALWIALAVLPGRAWPAWTGALGLVLVLAGLVYVAWAVPRALPTPPRPWGPRFELDFWLVLTVVALNVLALLWRVIPRSKPPSPPPDREWVFVHRVFLAMAVAYLLVQVTFSTNKLMNSVFAAPPLLILGITDLSRLLRARVMSGAFSVGARAWRLAALAVLLLMLGGRRLEAAWQMVRGDEARSELTASFSHRYLRGIKSTPERVKSVEALLRYLEARLRPGDFLHQEDDCPMIYFLARARPALPRIWSPARRGFPRAERQRMLDYMLEHNRAPEYYVRWNREQPIRRLLDSPRIVVHLDGSRRTLSADDPILLYFAEHYRPVATFGRFEVFERFSPPASPTVAASSPATADQSLDLLALLPEWRLAGATGGCELGRNEHGGPRVMFDLEEDERVTLLVGKRVPPTARLLPAGKQVDFRLRVELTDQAAATLVLRLCSDPTPRSGLVGRRVVLGDGLTTFTVYTAREPVYIWPVFQLTGRGEFALVELSTTSLQP